MGLWHLTAFCNPNSYDIRDIKPYGAYEIISGVWYVRPPDVPKDWGPAYWDESMWNHAETTLALINSVRELPEPDRTRQGAMLYDALHNDRSRAFSEHGYGWTDPGNVIWKMLDLEPSHPLAFLIQCAHDAPKLVSPATYDKLPGHEDLHSVSGGEGVVGVLQGVRQEGSALSPSRRVQGMSESEDASPSSVSEGQPRAEGMQPLRRDQANSGVQGSLLPPLHQPLSAREGSQGSRGGVGDLGGVPPKWLPDEGVRDHLRAIRGDAGGTGRALRDLSGDEGGFRQAGVLRGSQPQDWPGSSFTLPEVQLRGEASGRRPGAGSAGDGIHRDPLDHYLAYVEAHLDLESSEPLAFLVECKRRMGQGLDVTAEYHDPEFATEEPKYGWSVKRGVQALHGAGSWRSMFGDAPMTGAPWPRHTFKRGEYAEQHRDNVHAVIRNPVSHMQALDPRELHSTQDNLTRAGVSYYLHSPEYREQGATYADQHNEGNKVPVVLHTQGKYVILAGHHRAAAQLLKGEPLHAAVVQEGAAHDGPEADGSVRHAVAVPGRVSEPARHQAGQDGSAGGQRHPQGRDRSPADGRGRDGRADAAETGRFPGADHQPHLAGSHRTAAVGHKPPYDPDLSGDENRSRHSAWRSGIRHALSMGHLTPDEAISHGYTGQGHDQDLNTPHGLGWQPLPHTLYHATADVDSVRKHGLMSRDELSQGRGKGLGGGESDTISYTDDEATAHHIKRALHEFHDVVNGRKSIKDMYDEARLGVGASEPYHQGVHSYYGPPGSHRFESLMSGHAYTSEPFSTQEDMDKMHPGEGWKPHPSSEPMSTPRGDVHLHWQRPRTKDEDREAAANVYKAVAGHREVAGGPMDPLFHGNDIEGFAKLDPKKFAVVKAHPKQGAQGYRVGALGEWRTTTGKNVDLADEEPNVKTAKADDEPFTGVYIMAHVVPEQASKLAVDGGEKPEELHVTLGFLKDDADKYDQEIRRSLNEALARTWSGPFEANAFAVAVFNADNKPDDEQPPCAVLLLQSEQLAKVHEAVSAAIDSTDGVESSTDYPIWTPHVTLGYGLDADNVPTGRLGPVRFDRLVIGWGEEKVDLTGLRHESLRDLDWDTFKQIKESSDY